MGVKLLSTILLILVSALPAHGLTTYNITDLGTLGGHESVPLGINNSGHVVGYSTNSEGWRRAFHYYGGTMHDLNAHTAFDHGWDDISSYANDINDSGMIIGRNRLPGYAYFEGWVYQDGAYSPVNVTYGSMFQFVSVNSHGVAAGTLFDNSTDMYPAVYRDNASDMLQAFGGAYDINDNEVVVGAYANSYEDFWQACVWENGEPFSAGLIVDPDPNRRRSAANGVNNLNQVVGYYEIYDRTIEDYYRVSFLWDADSGAVTNLGDLGGMESVANKINDSGQVVGFSTTAASERHAFIYADGQLLDLNDLIGINYDWEYLKEAIDINEQGQIIGTGVVDGELHAFLADPVPLPGTVWLLGPVIFCILGIKKRCSNL